MDPKGNGYTIGGLQHDARPPVGKIRQIGYWVSRESAAMSDAKTAPELGRGIYTMADVARYAGMHHSTVRSWFRTRGVLESDFIETDGEFCVSFYDLLDSIVARQFRRHGVRMHTVRRAYRKLADILETSHPFCHRGLYTGGRKIIVTASIGSTELRDAITNQLFFEHIKERLANVSYSSLTRLAERIDISPGVVINPQVAMGNPVIKGTGVTTYVVRNAFYANDKDYDLVGYSYGLTDHEIDCAVIFEDRISKAAA